MAHNNTSLSIIKHDESINYILCPICGMIMKPNDRNLCLKCLTSEIDISADILKKNQKLRIKQCDSCKRFYDKSTSKWKTTEIGSPDLKDILLHKIRGLYKKGNTIRASSFIERESHSKQIMIEIELEQQVVFDDEEILKIDDTLRIAFKIERQSCTECAVSTDLHLSWKSCVQIRQSSDVGHCRLLLFLEQLLIKHHHDSFLNCCRIEESKNGFNFYFNQVHMARLFMSHLKQIIAINTNMKQIAANNEKCAKNNIQKYKSMYYGELPSINANDLCLIPTKLQKKCGGHSPLMLCCKVSSSLHFIEPMFGHRFELDAKQYFRSNFKSICGVDELCVFYVVSVIPMKHGKYGNLWECELVRESDLGENEEILESVTSGDWICACEGEMVRGYDINKLSQNRIDLFGDEMKRFSKKHKICDVIIVEKYDDRFLDFKRKRKWKLKSVHGMNVIDGAQMERDYELFLNQLELHKQLRAQINLYKNEKYKESEQKQDDIQTVDDDDIMDDIKNKNDTILIIT